MARMMADCRRWPSETNCSLVIIGEEDEVVQAAAEHAASVHGHQNTEEMRAQLRDFLELVDRYMLERGAEGAFPGGRPTWGAHEGRAPRLLTTRHCSLGLIPASRPRRQSRSETAVTRRHDGSRRVGRRRRPQRRQPALRSTPRAAAGELVAALLSDRQRWTMSLNPLPAPDPRLERRWVPRRGLCAAPPITAIVLLLDVRLQRVGGLRRDAEGQLGAVLDPHLDDPFAAVAHGRATMSRN